jgi:hypothetical protein
LEVFEEVSREKLAWKSMISFPESLSLLLNESPTLAKSLSRRTAMQTRDKRRRVPCGEDLDHLERYRKMGHHTVATAAALYYCKTRRICPPEWLVEEAALFIVEMLKHEKAPAQGRNASQLARFRQECCDIERWTAVQEVRAMRSSAKQNDGRFKANPDKAANRIRSHRQGRIG